MEEAESWLFSGQPSSSGEDLTDNAVWMCMEMLPRVVAAAYLRSTSPALRARSRIRASSCCARFTFAMRQRISSAKLSML
jgi:hypothetical protein